MTERTRERDDERDEHADESSYDVVDEPDETLPVESEREEWDDTYHNVIARTFADIGETMENELHEHLDDEGVEKLAMLRSDLDELAEAYNQ